MNWKTALSVLSVVLLLVGASGCQQPKSEQASVLSAEDSAAIEKAIDSAMAAYVAKNIEGYMASFSPDVVNIEYERCYRGAEEMLEKHLKPEMAQYTMTTYKASQRHIQGRGGLAYVNERNIVDFKDKDGKAHSSDSVWTSYVLEKAADGKWKIVQCHFSGPPL